MKRIGAYGRSSQTVDTPFQDLLYTCLVSASRRPKSLLHRQSFVYDLDNSKERFLLHSYIVDSKRLYHHTRYQHALSDSHQLSPTSAKPSTLHAQIISRIPINTKEQ